MELKVNTVVKEKYMDTDVDSLTFHFDDTKDESLVSEYEVPDSMPFMILISTKIGNDSPSWIEIVNPEGFLKEDNPVYPDIDIISGDRKMSFPEAIKDFLN